jgi:hypothetical protein
MLLGNQQQSRETADVQFGEVVDTERWPKPLVTQSFEHLP